MAYTTMSWKKRTRAASFMHEMSCKQYFF